MNLIILSSIFLAVPLIVSGVFHMLVVQKDWFTYLAIPISTPIFGKNKTWRGLVIMALATIPGVYIAKLLTPPVQSDLFISFQTANSWELGFYLGIAYALSELPNSFIKRRFNIAPGESADQYAFLFGFFDQADSVIGCVFVYWVMLSLSLEVMIAMIILGPLVHIVMNFSLFTLRLRKHPF